MLIFKLGKFQVRLQDAFNPLTYSIIPLNGSFNDFRGSAALVLVRHSSIVVLKNFVICLYKRRSLGVLRGQTKAYYTHIRVFELT